MKMYVIRFYFLRGLDLFPHLLYHKTSYGTFWWTIRLFQASRSCSS
ncbi:hypothetical protein BH24BAC1_BH24BAC1_28630 [soil metagenome]